jgi:SPP1 gp7 family putative phage head morphogenesis protein
MARYRSLRSQIASELDTYAQFMTGSVTDGQRAAATMALEHSATAINSVAVESQVAVNFNKLPTSAVENLIGTAGDGSPLRAVLDDAARGAGDRLGQQLVNGIALGRGPLDVARTAMRLGLGMSFTRMQTIARTEQLRAYREATQQSYRASNVVVGYRRLAARDERTCPGCLMADGNVYPLGEPFDQHPNCRCVALPVLRNVPPVAYQVGQEWFTEQPESTQRAILGKGRYEAWRSGKATLDDMVRRVDDPTWGGAIVPARVGDLPGGGRRAIPGGRTAPRLPVVQPPPRLPMQADTVELLPLADALPQPPPLTVAERAARTVEKNELWDKTIENAAAINPATGEQILRKAGNKDSIWFNADELARMRGSILTHNHPKPLYGNDPLSFSLSDVRLAARNGLQEIRAVGNKYAYSLKTSGLGWEDIEPIYNAADEAVARAMTPQLMNYRMGVGQSEFEHLHRVWLEVEKHFGKDKFNYQRFIHDYGD